MRVRLWLVRVRVDGVDRHQYRAAAAEVGRAQAWYEERSVLAAAESCKNSLGPLRSTARTSLERSRSSGAQLVLDRVDERLRQTRLRQEHVSAGLHDLPSVLRERMAAHDNNSDSSCSRIRSQAPDQIEAIIDPSRKRSISDDCGIRLS
jgi:hypothetical protein